MKNTDKVTLSIGQLKKLIKESKTNRFYLDDRDIVDSFKDDITIGEIWDDGGIQLYHPKDYSDRELKRIAQDLAYELGFEHGDEAWFYDKHDHHFKTIIL